MKYVLCWVAFLTVFTIPFGCSGPEHPQLQYSIRKTQLDTMPALEVRLTFSPDADGITELHYPDAAWGEEDLYQVLRDVKVSEGEAELEMVRDSGWIALSHDPDLESLSLTYLLVQDTPMGADGEDPTYRPIIQPEYFHIFAHNLFMIPGHYQETEASMADIRLSWKGWEKEEVIHNSFGSGSLEQNLGALSIEKFQSAIFTGGDFRVYSEEINGNQLLLAIRGEWMPFTDASVREVLLNTVRAQRAFWDDHSQEYFTVTMRPYQQENGSSFQGTGLTNSFATSMSNNSNTELDQLVYLFNHELMHNWIGHSIQNEAEEAQYWFSEGFTEYYTARNIADNAIGGHDWGFFIDQVNEKIRLLEGSPVRSAPNSEINYDNFWRDQEYGKLPYHRGFLYAFYLDQQIRAVSGGKQSLDDVMRDLLVSARAENQKLSHPHFLESLAPYLVEDPKPFFERHILQGEALPLKHLLDQLGLEYRMGAELFDLGFTFNAERDQVVAVDSASVAFRTGVRKGDRVTSRAIYFGSIGQPVELTLERGGTKVPVSFLPVRKAEIPQLENNPRNQVFFSK